MSFFDMLKFWLAKELIPVFLLLGLFVLVLLGVILWEVLLWLRRTIQRKETK